VFEAEPFVEADRTFVAHQWVDEHGVHSRPGEAPLHGEPHHRGADAASAIVG